MLRSAQRLMPPLTLYNCPDCSYKTASLRKLGRHRSMNHAGIRYRCQQCDFVTGYQSNFYRHRKQVHNGGGPLYTKEEASVLSPTNTALPNPYMFDVDGLRASSDAIVSSQPRLALSQAAAAAATMAALNPLFHLYPAGMLYAALYNNALIASAEAAKFNFTQSYNALASPPQRLSAFKVPSEKEELRCNQCGLEFSNLSALEQHMASHFSLFPAIATDFTFDTRKSPVIESELKCEIKKEDELASCDFDGGVLELSESNRKSVIDNQRCKAIECDVKEEFKELTNLPATATVKSESQSSKESSVACNSASVANVADAKGSINKYTRNYCCTYGCGFQTRESRAYLHHLRDVHSERFAIFYCDLCVYASKFLAKVNRHKQLIHGIDISGYAGSSSYSAFSNDGVDEVVDDAGFVKRPPNYTGIKEVVDCKKATPASESDATSTTVVQPRKKSSDSGRSSMKCPQCKYATDDNQRYKKHLRCHQTQAPTACQLCEFKTVYSWNLDRHLRCHALPARYRCLKCSFSQNTRQSMSFHLQHHHHRIVRSCAVQTDTADDNIPFCVDVASEPFIFEKHAVLVLDDTIIIPKTTTDANASKGDSQQLDVIQTVADDDNLKIVAKKLDTESKIADNLDIHCSNNNSNSNTVTSISSGRRQPTLDELAASCAAAGLTNGSRNKRAKYMAEQEVIESPNSPKNFKEFENDPDVRRRTCSICGYQGKWISEMLRHRRVHTNERPFKCKYCSRTSKWKADLIRHVAKVHGVRVVSKFSRSRTFENDQIKMRVKKSFGCNGEEKVGGRTFGVGENVLVDTENIKKLPESGNQHHHYHTRSSSSKKPERTPTFVRWRSSRRRNCYSDSENADLSPFDYAANDISPRSSGILDKYLLVQTRKQGDTILACKMCPYETRDLHTFRAHTQKHENKKPYQCSTCGYRSNWSSDVHKHIRLKKMGHELAYVVKLSGSNNRSETPVSVVDDDGEENQSDSVKRLLLSNSSGNSGLGNGQLIWKCMQCKQYANECRSDVIDHLSQTHNVPAYACPFCNFSSMYRKTAIYHMQSTHQSETSNIVENLTSEYVRQKAHSNRSPSGGHQDDFEKRHVLPPLKKRKLFNGDLEDDDQLSSQKCERCPFQTSDKEQLDMHSKGHQRPIGLFSYKCVFCDWNAKKKHCVVQHMTVHCADPNVYAGKVSLFGCSPKKSANDALRNAVSHVKDDVAIPVGNDCESAMIRKASLGFAEFSEVMQDFSALLGDGSSDCLQDDDTLQKEIWHEVAGANQSTLTVLNGSMFDDNDLNDEHSVEGSEDEVDIGEEDSLSHAVADDVSKEIQKVNMTIGGTQRCMWQCRYCPHVSKRRANIRSHESKHFKNGATESSAALAILKCPKCSFYGDRQLLGIHYKSHLGNESLKLAAAQQQTSAADQTGLCLAASSPSVASESSESHKTTSTPDSVNSLPAATTTTTTTKPLLTKPKKHACPDCPARFADRTQLKRHQVFHGCKLRYSCPLCNYAVNFAINLTKHLKSHHQVNDPAPYIAKIEEEMALRCGLPSKVSVARKAADLQAADENTAVSVAADSCSDGRPSLKLKICIPKCTGAPTCDSALTVSSQPAAADPENACQHSSDVIGPQQHALLNCYFCSWSGIPTHLKEHLRIHLADDVTAA